MKHLFQTILVFVLFSNVHFAAFSQKYPDMVKVKGGFFLMGDIKKDYVPRKVSPVRPLAGRNLAAIRDSSILENNGRLRKFEVRDFNISVHPISVEQYNAYCYSMGFDMPKLPEDIKLTDPMVNVSFEDAESYCRWLSRKTGKKYRLTAESEWEYAASGANLNRPKGEDYQPDGSKYKDIAIDNNRVLKSNGLVWEWIINVYADRNWAEYKPRQKRVVRKGITGKKIANEQPYHRKGLFQDSTTVDVGFRVAESLVEFKRFKPTPYLYGEISKKP